MNRCRLCSSKIDLVNIFDSNLKNSRELRCFIILATGIEIRETDVVSKFVCRHCCILAIKIYKYRTKAVANDKILKEQCGQHYSPPPSPPLSSFDTSKNESRSDSSETENTNHQNVSVTKNSKSDLIKKHPSVEELRRLHPNIILPSQIFQSHINPVITIDKTEVIEWFQKHGSRQYDSSSVVVNEFYTKLKKKLKNVTIRKVIPETGNDKIVNVCCKHNEKENANKEDGNSNYVAASKRRVVSHNVAKKRTSGIRTHERKMERKKKAYEATDSDTEIMPSPKRKNQIVSNEMQKEIFTSFLGLTPSEKQSISDKKASDVTDKTSPCKSTMFETFKEVNLFVCNICNRVCDTRKELTEHQRTHLYCKFCKTKVKSIDALLEHNNEACFVNLTRNLPNVLLIRADKDPNIIDKYGKAFEILKDDQEESDEDENSEIIPLIEEVNIPVGRDEFLDEMQTNFEIVPSYNNEIIMPESSGRVDLKDPMLRSVLANSLSNEKHSEELEHYIEKSIGNGGATQKSKRNLCSTVSCSSENVVYISDESGDEATSNKNRKIVSPKVNNLIEDVTVVQPIESVSIIRPEIKISQNTICPQVGQPMNSKSLASLEESIIQALFKKYSISKSTNRTTQVFLPSETSIKVLGNRLMSVENMFLVLNMHKIPVELNCNDSIKIDFKRTIENTLKHKFSFNWNKCGINELKRRCLSTAPSALNRQLLNEVVQIEDDSFIAVAATTVSTTTTSDCVVVSENGIAKKIVVNNLDVRTDTIPTVLNGNNFFSSYNNNNSNTQTKVMPLVPLRKVPPSNNDQSKSSSQCGSTVQVVVPKPSPHIQTVSVPQNHLQIPIASSNTIILNQINTLSRQSFGQKLLLPGPFFSSNVTTVSPSTNITCSETHNKEQSVGSVTNSCRKIIVVTQNKTLDQNDMNKKVENPAVAVTTNCSSTTVTENVSVQGSSSTSLLRVRNLWELTGHKT